MSKTIQNANTETAIDTAKELNDYYMEPIPMMLIKDKSKKKDDLTVTINGVNYQIKRGIPVTVPRCVALAVERSRKQEQEAEDYIESLKEI